MLLQFCWFSKSYIKPKDGITKEKEMNKHRFLKSLLNRGDVCDTLLPATPLQVTLHFLA